MGEIFFFAFRNIKLRIGLIIVLFFLLLGIFGPMVSKYQDPLDYVGQGYQPPSRDHWLGTTTFGQDVFTQLVYGIRSSFFVGLVRGGIATIIGLVMGSLQDTKEDG